MSYQAVKEYLALLWARYQESNRRCKSKILDEIVSNIGVHRKSAIRLMNSKSAPRSTRGQKGGGRRRYSEESKEHLGRLWKMMGYMCSSRMKAGIPIWISSYPEQIGEEVRLELLRMSESSIDRFLKPVKAEFRRKSNTGTRRGVRKFVTEIPVRDCSMKIEVPGHCEVDCVAHCGGSLSGEFAWTLTFTDILTGWTECESIWSKTGYEVRNALSRIEQRLPFKLTHLYSDNGTEFMNEEVIERYARSKNREQNIIFQRGRAYKKNDQCYVEQKNYTHVRFLFGYGRIDWKKAVNMMNNVYRGNWRRVQNFFFPQQRLELKFRIGSKQKRKMSKPMTPFQRLRPFLNTEKLDVLEKEMGQTEPVLAMKKVRQAVKNINGYFKHSMDKAEYGKVVK